MIAEIDYQLGRLLDCVDDHWPHYLLYLAGMLMLGTLLGIGIALGRR